MEKLLRNVVALMMLLCFSAPAWAIELVDGVYQISSAADLRAFAELVNGGETAVDAVLTADIVADADQPMIGQTLATAFSGHFDGQGHCITLQWTGERTGSGPLGSVRLSERLHQQLAPRRNL